MNEPVLEAAGLGRRVAPDPPRRPLPEPLRRIFRVRATGEADQLEDDEIDEEPEDFPVVHSTRLWAFRGLDLSLRRGETLAVVGGPGAGKTTLVRTLAGLVHPSEGSVVAHGRVVALLDDNVRLMRADWSLGRNARFLSRFFGGSRAEADAAVGHTVAAIPRASAQTQLGTLGTVGIHQFGHAVLLALAPAVVLVDELLVQRDDGPASELRERIEELRGGGTAVLVASSPSEVPLLPAGATLDLDALTTS